MFDSDQLFATYGLKPGDEVDDRDTWLTLSMTSYDGFGSVAQQFKIRPTHRLLVELAQRRVGTCVSDLARAKLDLETLIAKGDV